jgi:hypothetical protein
MEKEWMNGLGRNGWIEGRRWSDEQQDYLTFHPFFRKVDTLNTYLTDSLSGPKLQMVRHKNIKPITCRPYVQTKIQTIGVTQIQRTHFQQSPVSC